LHQPYFSKAIPKSVFLRGGILSGYGLTPAKTFFLILMWGEIAMMRLPWVEACEHNTSRKAGYNQAIPEIDMFRDKGDE
jgi:hypothetical protein